MIPQGSNFPPWLKPEAGMRVRIVTEPAPKDNPKLKSPLYCEVEHKGNSYTLGFSWTAYHKIKACDIFGADTENWVGKEIQYLGMEKTGKGGKAHVWKPIVPEIDLEKAPF
jgi:hypothetical protein